MQAVILAGGLGTRLRPITETIPKPMAIVAGAPYLEHQLRLLARQDIRDVILLTGYLGEQIEDYFGDGGRLGVAIRYSMEPEPLGTGGALRLADALLAQSFLLLYGDSYLPIDYRAMMRRLETSAADGIVAVYDNRMGDTSVRNNIAIDARQNVTCYAKDAAAPCALEYVEAGVMAFRREVVGLIVPGRRVALEQEIFPLLIARGSLLAQVTTQRFYDIGTLERLQTIEDYFAYDYYPDAVSN
jgi:NDP-sugar pyrophosphorylase family protein